MYISIERFATLPNVIVRPLIQLFVWPLRPLIAVKRARARTPVHSVENVQLMSVHYSMPLLKLIIKDSVKN